MLRFVMTFCLIAFSYSAFSEDRNIALSCNGTESNFYKFFVWDTKENVNISLVFSEGYLTRIYKEGGVSSNHKIHCKWEDEQIKCTSFDYYKYKNLEKPEQDRNYQIKIDRATGSIFMNWNNRYHGICNLRQKF
jgi:hypothetical protein